MNKESSFGPHLTLDLSECNPEKLKDLDFCFKLLDELPEKISMTKITQPHVFHYSGLVPEDKGITGMVIIAESHISLHTFQDKGYCFVDVFSCKDFYVEFAADYIIKAFEAKKVDKNIVQRGKEFPREKIIKKEELIIN